MLLKENEIRREDGKKEVRKIMRINLKPMNLNKGKRIIIELEKKMEKAKYFNEKQKTYNYCRGVVALVLVFGGCRVVCTLVET